MEENLVRFCEARLGYGRKVVLENVTFDLKKREFLGIIGPNGSGKTTLLRALLGLLQPSGGAIQRQPGLRFGYVMQRQSFDTQFPFTVLEIARMGLLARPKEQTKSGRENDPILREALEVTGLSGLSDRLYRELSGGQKQRVLIARALASDPEVLVLDEPTNDLDLQGETQVLALLKQIRHARGVTVVMVTHLLQLLLDHADRFVFLRNGASFVHRPDELLQTDLLSRMYGFPVRVKVFEGRRFLCTGG